jgi:hypothetical protein
MCEASPTTQAGHDWLGRVALTCAIIAWVVESMLLLADLGWVPRAVKLGGITLLATAACWLAAVGGGLVATVGYRSKAGLIAVVVGLLLPASVIGLVLCVGSGWLD